MVSGISASLSGIKAAEVRLQESANNIANISSTQTIENGVTTEQKFIPNQVTDISNGDTGGVHSLVRPVDNASTINIQGIDPAAQSNVDLGTEAVNQIEAKNAYKANLITLEAQNKTVEQVLSIIS